jgi:hypothetical protein
MLGEDWISRQTRKHMIEEYPYLQPRDMFTDKIPKSYDYDYINGEHDLPEGWLELFLQCCEDIKEPLTNAGCLDKFRFTQIKEKFGMMRLYTISAPREVQDIISKYEFLSQQVCCECGMPAVVLTTDWVYPYCSDHIKGTAEATNIKPIEIKTSFTRSSWSSGVTTEVIFDCKDEWERYLNRINYKESIE